MVQYVEHKIIKPMHIFTMTVQNATKDRSSELIGLEMTNNHLDIILSTQTLSQFLSI